MFCVELSSAYCSIEVNSCRSYFFELVSPTFIAFGNSTNRQGAYRDLIGIRSVDQAVPSIFTW